MPIDRIPSAALESGVPTRSQLPAGSVLQVVQTYKTDASSYSGIDTYPTIMSATITPTSATSKILLMTSVSYGFANGQAQFEWYFYFDRAIGGAATQVVGQGDAAGSRQRGVFQPGGFTGQQTEMTLGTLSNCYLDSPATTQQIVYYLKMRAHNNAFYINRSPVDNDGSGYSKRLTSNLTLMEIAG
jgi:hypothetical protein